MQTKQVRLQLKKIGENGTFTGLAAVYGNRDLGGDVILPGAFTKTIHDNDGKFPLMYGHKVNVGISIVEDSLEGLLCNGKMNIDVQFARDVHSNMKFFHENGLQFGMSIGYLPVPDKVELKNGTRYHKELQLFENTLTEFPMNTRARVQQLKEMILQHKADFATELEAVETWAKRYQMITALDSALSSIVWSNDSAEEKVQKAEESISQFETAFLEFLPKLIALMDSRFKSAIDEFEQKEGREIFSEKRIDTAKDSLRALLGAAHKSTEPAFDHSALTTKVDSILALFPQ